MVDKSKWMNSSQQDQLLRTFFSENIPIKINFDYWSSYSGYDAKVLHLTSFAGPSQCITYAIHEMGHLIEIDDNRVFKRGWGLTTPELYISGRYSHMCPVPITWQPSQRECRVIAIQREIERSIGIETSDRDLISSLSFMCDWSNVPTGEYETILEADENRYNVLERYLNQVSEKYTIQYIMNEWNRKIELIRAHEN